MGRRKYLLILLFLSGFYIGRAQEMTFDVADSTSRALLESAEFKQLIKFGEHAIDHGIDFPALRSRLGYARLMTGNYSAALREYTIVFKNDSYDQDARYYAYLCHIYLNQMMAASYSAAYLDTSKLNVVRTKKFSFLNAGFELGIKYNDDYYRGNAFYNRIYLSNRLSWKWQLDQSLFYFNQPVQNGDTDDKTMDRQTEYYGKLSYSFSDKLALFGVYHYLNTNYQNITYNSYILSSGLRYNATYFEIQADVDWGYMISHHLQQYNGELFFYPFGNLNLYTVSRLSLLYQNSSNNTIFTQNIGFKVLKRVWMETSVTFGKLNNYTGSDGLYIYNSVDPSTFMAGETGFFELSKHVQFSLNYTFENKHDATNSLNYHQHSFTGGLLWKF